MMPVRFGLLPGIAGLALLSLAPVIPPAQAQSYKRFGRWLGFCDNLRSCSAFGTTDGASSPTFLRVSRAADAKAEAEWSVGWSIDDLPAGTRLRLSFGEAKLAGLPPEPVAVEVKDSAVLVKLPGETDTLIAAMRQAHVLTGEFLLPEGKKLAQPDDAKAEISLDGAVAALLWIDEQQKRVGTATALVKKGSASAVPALPAPPVVHLAPAVPQDRLPAKPPPGIAKAVKAAGCEPPTDQPELKPSAYRLSGSRILWEATCMVGAYSTSSLFFVAEAASLKAVSVPQPVLTKDDKAATREISLAEFDPKTMELRALYKSRGPGDCGDEGRWGWDGTAFQLLEFKSMPECMGVSSDFWPVVYRAEAKR